jgi:hypothetical protein
VVRGRYHRLYLRDRGTTKVLEIPDCVSTESVDDEALDLEASRLRASLHLDGVLTVGIVGSCIWSPRLGIAYGWDLIEAIGLLQDQPIHAVIIGGGDGIDHLSHRIAELGIGEMVTMLGPIPLVSIDKYVRILDVCLSTQTDDLVGWVRTTGKLPLYLLNNRFVLTTDVGTASWVLPASMRVPYYGVVDPGYPFRVAERLKLLIHDRSLLNVRLEDRVIVNDHFDARRLRSELAEALGLCEKPKLMSGWQ